MRITKAHSQGSALLAVLWLSAVLSVIALTVASTVRGEVERAATASDDTRAYFLAQSAIQRAILYIEWGRSFVPAAYYQPGMGPLHFQFPNGQATVDVIPESSKINISNCLPADLFRLLLALDVPPDRAQIITAAAIDWRSAPPNGQATPFDLFYLQQNPSFVSTHTSFQDIEELLLVQGMTPEIFYGTWDRDDSQKPSRLVQRIGLRDCISVYANGTFDVNSTPLPVLIAAGLAPDAAAAIVQQRNIQPFPNFAAVRAFTQAMGPAARRIVLGGTTMYTIRATGQPYTPNGVLSDMRRTVSALVKFAPPDTGLLFEVLRWYDRG